MRSKGALPGPVRTQDGERLPLAELDRDVAEHRPLPVVAAKVAQPDRGLRAPRSGTGHRCLEGAFHETRITKRTWMRRATVLVEWSDSRSRSPWACSPSPSWTRPGPRRSPPIARRGSSGTSPLPSARQAAGGLERGVRLPAQGDAYFTWDPVLRRQPNRDWRRWGTDDLVRTTLRVLREYRRRASRGAPGRCRRSRPASRRLLRPRGRRRDRPCNAPERARRRRLLPTTGRGRATTGAPGAGRHWRSRRISSTSSSRPAPCCVYTGPSLPLVGPEGIVIPLVNHDNHLHVRIAP